MSDIHIDDFYRDAAKTLAALYAHFPRRTTLYVEDIGGPDTPDEFGLHSLRHQACFETFLWLAQSGYLRYEQLVRQEAVDQAVLTHRGFLTLSAPLPSTPTDEPEAALPDHRLAIHQIRQQLKTGTSLSLAEVMDRILRLSRQIGES